MFRQWVRGEEYWGGGVSRLSRILFSPGRQAGVETDGLGRALSDRDDSRSKSLVER